MHLPLLSLGATPPFPLFLAECWKLRFFTFAFTFTTALTVVLSAPPYVVLPTTPQRDNFHNGLILGSKQ